MRIDFGPASHKAPGPLNLALKLCSRIAEAFPGSKKLTLGRST
jgi:hypothetical protein